MNDPRRAFEEFLKNSNHFSDAMNSHRRATADVVASLCELLVETQAVERQAILDKLKDMENQRGPADLSDAVGRRALCQLIRDRLNER